MTRTNNRKMLEHAQHLNALAYALRNARQAGVLGQMHGVDEASLDAVQAYAEVMAKNYEERLNAERGVATFGALPVGAVFVEEYESAGRGTHEEWIDELSTMDIFVKFDLGEHDQNVVQLYIEDDEMTVLSDSDGDDDRRFEDDTQVTQVPPDVVAVLQGMLRSATRRMRDKFERDTEIHNMLTTYLTTAAQGG